MVNILLSPTVIFLIFTQCIFLYKVWCYRLMLKKKDIKLIQHYLDVKLLQDMLSDNLTITNDKAFCAHAISFITEYFNIDNVIIIDSLNETYGSKFEDDAKYQEIIKYLKTHQQDFINTLSENELVSLEMNSKDCNLNLHISYFISDESSDGMIICVENTPSLLSKVEIATLTAIINLLKKRLLS